MDLTWGKYSIYNSQGGYNRTRTTGTTGTTTSTTTSDSVLPLHMPQYTLLLQSTSTSDSSTHIVCWVVDDVHLLTQLLLHPSHVVSGFITNRPLQLLGLVRELYRDTC